MAVTDCIENTAFINELSVKEFQNSLKLIWDLNI
jgi:hypothetical protein